MRTPLVAANWKMNGSRASVDQLVRAVLAGISAANNREVLLCPSFVFLEQVGNLLAGSAIQLGAQNLSTEKAGAFTGEISGAMLKDALCRYVLVGHSERRSLMSESSDIVARKFVAAQQAGLIPVLCVGETLADRKAGRTLAVITEQFNAVADAAGIDGFANAVVAYEPVWAIGTGETATPEQAQEVHAALRAMVASGSVRIAAELRLLYGGSVKAANATELFSMPDIDGGLIGGASLDAQEFLGICAAAAS
jgi:triosephosphate isomerase (TIM)